MSASLLQLTNIAKSFGAVRALKSVSFDLLPGEVHALIGENGAGKSTLIKIITGAHQPDTGELRIDGRLVERLTPASAHALGIAAIYQQPALFPDLTVAENIALGLEKPSPVRPIRWRERASRAAQLLKRVGADISPESEIRHLSMPQQQLVEIARALGAGARLLIMDEPTASLTAAEVVLLVELVKNLRRDGVGIIYISHRLEEVFQMADRVTVLRDGESVGTRSLKSPIAPREPLNPPSAGFPLSLSEGEKAGGGAAQRNQVVLPEAGSDLASSHSLLPSALTESDLIRLMVGREISTIFPPPEKAPGLPLFSVENLACSSSGIHNVNFEIRSGEILGLSGLVGAGRTELARVLFGLTPADSGVIRLDGKLVRITSPREAVAAGIAYVPEDRRRHGVILELPVAANVTMGIHQKIFPRSWLRFRAERTLASDYIRDLAIKAPSPQTRAANLSGGNQQKLALARWLASGPKVLLLDEPTQGVDVGAKAEIHKLIRRLAAQGLAVLMISSELPEILGMSDRIAIMRGGTITTILARSAADPHTIMAAALGQAA